MPQRQLSELTAADTLEKVCATKKRPQPRVVQPPFRNRLAHPPRQPALLLKEPSKMDAVKQASPKKGVEKP